jgi:hypothetical protein
LVYAVLCLEILVTFRITMSHTVRHRHRDLTIITVPLTLFF